MAEISAQMVRELREKTGAGMMDCKKALSETSGDFSKAEEWLRKKGATKAASKGSRVAAEGLVGAELTGGGSVGVIVELNSETDFVARNDEFVKLLAGLVAHVGRHSPTSVENLLEQAWTDGKKVKDALTEKVATIGENISVRRFERFAVSGGSLGQYLHANGRIAAMVEVLGSDKPEVAVLAKELAMQVAAMNPKYVNREQISAAVLDKEREFFREEIRNPPPPAPGEIRNPNKKPPPEERWPMIIEGKLGKFFENVCLVDQVSIKDDKKKVKDLVAEAGKAIGATLTVSRMARFEVGEGIEKKKDDLAAEVAKTLGQA
jgi:elongation factor Ts